MSEQITKKDLQKVFWRMQIFQWGANFERLQSSGVLYSLTPILKKLYKDSPVEDREKAILRHLQFFNTHCTTAGFVLGVTAALEESTKEHEKQTVSAIKTGLMGPLAGVGDGLFWFTIYPIIASIGATIAVEGNVLGALIVFFGWACINIPLKYFGIQFGYHRGLELFKSGDNEILGRLANAASILGLFVAGCLICTTIKINVPLTFASGEGTIVVQELIDKVMLKLLPVLATVFCYWFLKKNNGKYVTWLIFGIMMFGILMTWLGILG